MASHSSSREARARAQAKYDKAHRADYSNFYVKCHKEKDAEILAWLATKENRTQYIKALIKADMAASGN